MTRGNSAIIEDIWNNKMTETKMEIAKIEKEISTLKGKKNKILESIIDQKINAEDGKELLEKVKSEILDKDLD